MLRKILTLVISSYIIGNNLYAYTQIYTWWFVLCYIHLCIKVVHNNIFLLKIEI